MGIFLGILLLAAAVLWAVRTCNSFTARQMKIAEARSGIEVALTKRYDVLRKLLETSRGYLQQEYGMLLQTVQLRQQMTMEEIYTAENRMDALTEQMLAAAECHPVLGSSRVLRELRIGISDTEQHLEAARRVYNSNVALYNRAITTFPGSLLAGRRQPVPFCYAKQGVHQDLKATF